MKKILAVIMAAAMLMTAGCKRASDLVDDGKDPTDNAVVTPIPTATPTPEPEPKNTISLTTTLKMTNDWTIMDASASLP